MTVSFRQITFNTSATTTSSLAVSFGAGIAAGSIIAVAGEFTGPATGITISNDKGDHVTDSGLGIISNTNSGANTYVKAFLNPTSGSTTVTATYTGANSNISDIYIWEIAGLTNPIIDQVLSANSTGTIISSGTCGTLKSAPEAAISFCSPTIVPNSNGAGWLFGQGTLTTGNNGDGIDSTDGPAAEHQITSSTAGIAGTFNLGSSGTGQVWLVTFGSSGPIIIPPPSFVLARFQ